MSVTSSEGAAAPSRARPQAVGSCRSLALRPVPVSAPPYDDEPVGGGPPRPVLVARTPGPVGPLRALAPLRLVPPVASPAAVAAPAVLHPPVRPVAHALVQGLLEVLAGVRPVTQLTRRTSAELYDDLEALVRGRPRTVGARPGQGAVRSLHVQSPAPGVAEVCATVCHGPRAAAVALRLEVLDGHWCCTALTGLPGALVSR